MRKTMLNSAYVENLKTVTVLLDGCRVAEGRLVTFGVYVGSKSPVALTSVGLQFEVENCKGV
jgi:hypothetical protein